MKVCFAGGGTLGHVYPALSIINDDSFKKENDIYYIGSIKGLEKELINQSVNQDNIIYVNIKGLDRRFMGININNLKLIKYYCESYKEIKKFYERIKPDLVVGMGGYISYIAVKVAYKLKIKTIIHEQNGCFGLSNKLLINKVDKVLVSYKDLENAKNIIFTGNPRQTEVHKKYLDINIEKENTVLVVGGSRGAERINEIIISMKDYFEKEKIFCTLITGKKYYDENIEKLNNAKSQYFNIISFTNNLIYQLLVNKIVISRGGATTISEISALNKPCIYIPSPNVTNDHQSKNVRSIVENKCAIMLEEESINKEKIINSIEELINNYTYYKQNLESHNNIDSINEVIRICKEVANG